LAGWEDHQSRHFRPIGPVIAEAAGIKPPAGTKFLMVMGEKIGPEDRFSGEVEPCPDRMEMERLERDAQSP